MTRSSLLAALLLATQALNAGSRHETRPLDLGDRLELMVDDHLIDSMTGDVRLELQTPASGGRVLHFDKPWEGTTCFYVSVVHGDGLYRMYYRAPHIFLGFPKRFVSWRTRIADASENGVSDTVFMTSRDGLNWDRRFPQSFIRPGREKRNWYNRTNMTATGVVSTGDDEISLYVLRHYKFPTIHMERMVLRTDGFVSLNAGYRGGEVVTRPLTFQGNNLVLNFATAAGSIHVEIQDEAGRPLPGFALEESPLVWGDDIEHTVRWERSHAGATSKEPLKRIAGKPVRLRLVMKDADLFSLRFQ